jgi:hypothetical protein
MEFCPVCMLRRGLAGGVKSGECSVEEAVRPTTDEWEKGERLAKLVAHRRTLLLLDGMEPLQNPPGPQEGRLREPSLQALLRELAAFNRGYA